MARQTKNENIQRKLREGKERTSASSKQDGKLKKQREKNYERLGDGSNLSMSAGGRKGGDGDEDGQGTAQLIKLRIMRVYGKGKEEKIKRRYALRRRNSRALKVQKQLLGEVGRGGEESRSGGGDKTSICREIYDRDT